MRKKLVFGFAIIIFLAIVIFVARALVQQKEKSVDKLQVITTLFPLYDMAKNIGGEKADVSQLLPPGVEAHSFEPKPSDIVRINEADIFIYTGKFMEPWVEDILKSVNNKNLIVVDSSRGVKMIPGIFHDEDEPAGSPDPHIWLDFDNAQTMVDNIANAFMIKDSNNSEFYQNNTKEYKNKLIASDNNYRNTFEKCRRKTIIYGGHYAFGYLADRYGLKYSAAQGVSPDAEPTAKDLVNLVDQINKGQIKYLFYEELASPKIAETIAGETKAKLLLLNAAHNLAKDQFEAGVSFFNILDSNLENLKVGLECE